MGVQIAHMDFLRIHSPADQVAAHLRKQILKGSLSGEMPGVHQIAKELAVGSKTIIAALRTLEHDGVLVGQGPRRRRRIVLPADSTPHALRVAVLPFDSPARGTDYFIELRHQLEVAGHAPFFPNKTLTEFGLDIGRLARFVKKTKADTWVVSAGPREVLEWFAQQETPAFAHFGHRVGLPIAGTGPNKGPAIAKATRRLVELGHRRISLLCRRQLRQPQPDLAVRVFLGELEAAGVTTGAFNLPDWEESREDFGRLLDSLFGATPPTALILDEPFLYHAAYHHLAWGGLRVPQDVSLVCTDAAPDFAWCQPSVAHIRWDYRAVIRRIVRWANNVASGEHNRRQTFIKAEFIEGGTIGRAPDVQAHCKAAKKRKSNPS